MIFTSWKVVNTERIMMDNESLFKQFVKWGIFVAEIKHIFYLTINSVIAILHFYDMRRKTS